jgi:RNA-binding protein
VTEPVLRALEDALRRHELVKVRIGTESPEDRFEAAERLSSGAAAQVAQILGRTVLVYRRHPEKPRFEPSGLQGPGASKDGRARAPGARVARARRGHRGA